MKCAGGELTFFVSKFCALHSLLYFCKKNNPQFSYNEKDILRSPPGDCKFARQFPCCAQHFTCAQYETDAKRWQDIEQLFKRQGWAQWALAVKDAFPLNNDRSIQFKYVIASDVACSQKQLTDLVQKWITLEHPNVLPLPSGQTVDLKVQTLGTTWHTLIACFRLLTSAQSRKPSSNSKKIVCASPLLCRAT